ncbi:GNAT family N-acetyltransferase [Conexibacter stalactiti]|uniref:GNAT family N-acetyltransferase n=1 Tax=Conexibacter stalactiti TaxID=1940611 RepID=A0ABU4HSW9_9ACTN|nr:GNAT family N-acetyltransferase [Conexibacter stalactiti]MDW5596408.1 GNAT family N-acetyltransferase [Conexibacter stalactiti]MEC5037050.1 GNAT family N-acetyltransferase [Conexibacter stalactiti]
MNAPGELIALHVELLYRLDAGRRLVQTNEPDPQPAPRVFVGRTEDGVVVHPRHDLDPALAAEVVRLAGQLPRYPEGRGEAASYAPIEAAVAAAAPVVSRWHGLAYRFAEPSGDQHPEVIEIAGDRSALVGPFAEFQSELDEVAPFFAVVRDGAVVSGCYSARLTGAGAEAGVDTLPAFRGQGLAAAVVDAWRVAIARSGRTPLYSTSYDNAASQAVARRLGLVQYAETLSLR